MKIKKSDVVIIGGGLSGLCTAHFIKKQNPDLDIAILEKSSRVGGAIQSMHEDGYMAEWGPHGFLDNTPESRELLEDLDVENTIQKAPLKQFLRYICSDGELVQIPQTPPKIIKSNLLSLPSKIRVLGDLFIKPDPAEQSVAHWAARRFGRAILPFADIALTGTYAGDIERLSIDGAMPGLRRLELEYGSVLKGAIITQKKKPSGGMPSMISFKQGMEHLITLLAKDKTIYLDSSVSQFKRDPEGWTVSTEFSQFKAQHLVIATHINQALPLLSSLKPFKKQAVPEAIVCNVVAGFDSSAKIPFGFGYLAPKSENRFALGTLFSIHMFPGRAPEAMNLIEILVGGARNPERLDLDDNEIIERAIADVAQMIPLPQKTTFRKLIRPKVGIPQLEMGHLEFVRYRDSLQKDHENLQICGFGWEGIGINDMIKHARSAAAGVLKGTGSAREPAAIKGIYF